jgi:hypothetical protein
MQDDKGERMSLLLPHIEPDCDINLDVNARDASATIMSPSLSGDDVMRNAAKNVTFPKTKQKKIKKLKRYTCHIVQYNEYFIITISLLLQLAKLNPLVKYYSV